VPRPMIARRADCVRNVGLLLMLRGLLAVGGVVVAAVVPRPDGSDRLRPGCALGDAEFLVHTGRQPGLHPGHGPPRTRLWPEQRRRWPAQFFRRPAGDSHRGGLAVAALYLVVTITWLRDLDWVAMAVLAGPCSCGRRRGCAFSPTSGSTRRRAGESRISCAVGDLGLHAARYLMGGLRGAALGVLLGELVVLLWARSGRGPI